MHVVCKVVMAKTQVQSQLKSRGAVELKKFNFTKLKLARYANCRAFLAKNRLILDILEGTLFTPKFSTWLELRWGGWGGHYAHLKVTVCL